MRLQGKASPTGSTAGTSSRRGAFALLTIALALLGGATALPAAALPGACPQNEAIRVEQHATYLPDCRAYEQVSPTEKGGVDAFTPSFPLPAEVSALQGSAEGGSIAYQALTAFEEPQANLLGSAYLATRTAAGWQTSNLTPPSRGPIPTSVGAGFVGYDFSPDLSRVVIPMPWQALAPGMPPELVRLDNLFLRGSDGNYSLLTTASPKVPVPEGCVLCYAQRDIPAFAGASSDYAHLLFEASESLTPGAPGEGVENLYESYEALPGQPREVRLVGVLSDGSIPPAGSMPGAGIEDNRVNHYSAGPEHAYSGDVNHAISADGSRVLFSAVADGGQPDPSQSGLTELYDRLNGSQTIEISTPAPGATPANPAPAPAQFWAASADGSLVFFTSAAELTTQSNTGSANAGPDLYRYDVETEALTDLTVDANPADESSGAGVLGVVGASEDGSYVYFVATGKLSPQATDGRPNLYLSHAGTVTFIATLSKADSADWTSTPALSNAYLTPDGRHLAFTSTNSLTGYDNTDRSSGQPYSEVYEYSAQGEGGSLRCASCDPSGARPLGNAFTGASAGGYQKIGTPFYQPRVLSDDGARLFFSSPDPLTSPQATAHARVFEYENGIVYPISGSASSADDIFLDASPSGNDAFFATYDRLAGGDTDNLVDIYDVRAGGGFPPAPTAPPCPAEECRLPAAAGVPSPPTVGSALLAGAGNSTPAKRHTKHRRHSHRGHRPPKRHRAPGAAERVPNAAARPHRTRRARSEPSR